MIPPEGVIFSRIFGAFISLLNVRLRCFPLLSWYNNVDKLFPEDEFTELLLRGFSKSYSYL